MKVVENLLKNAYGEKLIDWIASMWTKNIY